jgi:hypothetical protein
MKFFGPMTKPWIGHTGFVRVGLLNETEHGAQNLISGSDHWITIFQLDNNNSNKREENDTLTPNLVQVGMSPNDETPSIRLKDVVI